MHILLKEQIIELEEIKINQRKKEENFSCSRINPSTNIQFYNNFSKVVIDKLDKKKLKTKEKNKNIKNLNSRVLGWWRSLRYPFKVATTSFL